MAFSLFLFQYLNLFILLIRGINRALTGKDRAHPLLPKMPPIHSSGHHGHQKGIGSGDMAAYQMEGKKQYLKKLKIGYPHTNQPSGGHFQGDVALSAQTDKQRGALNPQFHRNNQGHQRYQSYGQFQNKSDDEHKPQFDSNKGAHSGGVNQKPSTSDSVIMKNGAGQAPTSPIKQLYGSVDQAQHISHGHHGQGGPSGTYSTHQAANAMSPQNPQRKARSINQRIKNPKIYQSAVEMMQNNNFGNFSQNISGSGGQQSSAGGPAHHQQSLNAH